MIKSFEDISEQELTDLEHSRGDGRKMYADVADYRLTTVEENPDAPNQRRNGTLRGQAAAFIEAWGGVVPGRVLHHYMLTHAVKGKWDYGYVHMVSNKNLVKRGASRDWIRACGEMRAPHSLTAPPFLSREASPPQTVSIASIRDRAGDEHNLVHRHLSLTTEQIETRHNPRLVAYRDAERSGARFVALQNAEFAWLWDRCAGRTYAEQFIDRFAADAFEGAFARAATLPELKAPPAVVLQRSPAHRSISEYQACFAALARGIALLRADPDHVERAHERLVDHFLVQLGFDPYAEIGFRNGRIDMTLHVNGQPRLALEVKRDWRLREETVLDQAYNYALEHGIRFFAVTNGDNYILHDCWGGLVRARNEIARFQISELLEKDIRCLDWLRLREFAEG